MFYIFSNLQPFTLQRGSGALPGSSVSAAPGYGGWREGDSGARSGCSHDDVGQHLVHPAHGSQHDGGELPVRRRWPAGPGHVAGALLPEGGGRWNWMKASRTASSYQVWVCFKRRQMLGRVSEAQNQLRSKRRRRRGRDGRPSSRRRMDSCAHTRLWSKHFSVRLYLEDAVQPSWYCVFSTCMMLTVLTFLGGQTWMRCRFVIKISFLLK